MNEKDIDARCCHWAETYRAEYSHGIRRPYSKFNEHLPIGPCLSREDELRGRDELFFP